MTIDGMLGDGVEIRALGWQLVVRNGLWPAQGALSAPRQEAV
jgi:hypothetical protein